MRIKQLSAITLQTSAKNRLTALFRNAHFSQEGVGIAVVIIVVAAVLIGGIVLATPQIRNVILPSAKPVVYPSPSVAASQYSDKQQLYLRNKESIKQGLNLTDEQFDLLVQNADKN